MKSRISAFLATALLALSATVAAPVFADEAASAPAAPAASATAPAAPVDAAAPAAAPADAAAPTKEVIENPYGLDALWK
ncbi:MotA/TolQ/ExbB proton channel family protein, partial [Undibacterium jejuense]|nr:MotA/TolQ/ExbB proton channel family protein [Undibacterium jejuense]